MAEQTYYEYTALSGGTLQRSKLYADSERMVRAILREQGLVPIEIKKTTLQGADGQALDPMALVKERETTRRYYDVAIPAAGGENQRGEILATGEREARPQLRDRGLIPSIVAPKQLWHDLLLAGRVSTMQDAQAAARAAGRAQAFQGNRVQWAIHNLRRLFNGKIGLKEILFYSSQLSTMNEAGLSFNQSLDILSSLITNQRLRVIHEVVRLQILEGSSLADAYGLFDRELPKIFIELISVGEASGNLEQTLQRLVQHLEKQLDLQKKIQSAMSYPLIMILLICLIITGLMVFVVPTFIQLFSSFNVALPPTTKALLGMSWFMTHRWYLVPLIPLGLFLGVKGFLATRFGRQFFDLWEYRIPLFGPLIYKITISRVLHNLALFLNCGITIITALELTQQSVSNAYTSLKLEGIRVGVSQGMRLSALFEGSELFPPIINYLLIAGEESGSIDELLERGAKYIDQEVETLLKALTSAIEPLLTVVVAGAVMFVVGSLYLPLVGLLKGGTGGGI